MPASTLSDNLKDLEDVEARHEHSAATPLTDGHASAREIGKARPTETAEESRWAAPPTMKPRPPTDTASLLALLDNGLKAGLATRVQPIGFEPLDRVLGGGLRTHDLMVIAGPPGVGKTVATLQMARNLALSGSTVIFACYEHDPFTLLARLIAMEVGDIEVPHTNWYRMDGVRSLLDGVINGTTSLSSANSDPVLRAARASIDEYADRLHLVQATPSATGVDELAQLVQERSIGGPTTLFVDYLQKVRVPMGGKGHVEQVLQVTAALKEVALSCSLSVVAIGAISGAGLLKRRIHLPHLDAAIAVGYDADIVVLLNEKRHIVASNQLNYTSEQTERFRQRVVFSIEKNRGGIAPIDLEFTKSFEHFRFDPKGSFVSEQLVDDHSWG
jgi:replicative DNA helicase